MVVYMLSLIVDVDVDVVVLFFFNSNRLSSGTNDANTKSYYHQNQKSILTLLIINVNYARSDGPC